MRSRAPAFSDVLHNTSNIEAEDISSPIDNNRRKKLVKAFLMGLSHLLVLGATTSCKFEVIMNSLASFDLWIFTIVINSGLI